jgi:tumor protein p53-inducible protein 3
MPLFENQTLLPIVDHIFSADEIKEAHEKVESNKTIGKVIVNWNH